MKETYKYQDRFHNYPNHRYDKLNEMSYYLNGHIPHCKNHMRLLRGVEYKKFRMKHGIEPITMFSRNTTDRDLQKSFSCKLDRERRCDYIINGAWLLSTPYKLDMAKRALNHCKENYEQFCLENPSYHNKTNHQSHNNKSGNNSHGPFNKRPESLNFKHHHLYNNLHQQHSGQTSTGINSNESTSDDRDSINSEKFFKNLNPQNYLNHAAFINSHKNNNNNHHHNHNQNSENVNLLNSSHLNILNYYLPPEYDCALACMLLAEEECESVGESEILFRRALKAAEFQKEKSHETRHKNIDYEDRYQRDCKLVCYIKARLALCCRRVGKLQESVKLYREISKEYHSNSMSIDSLYDAWIEVCLERQYFADVNQLMTKYDETAHMSTVFIYWFGRVLKNLETRQIFTNPFDLVSKIFKTIFLDFCVIKNPSSSFDFKFNRQFKLISNPKETKRS